LKSKAPKAPLKKRESKANRAERLKEDRELKELRRLDNDPNDKITVIKTIVANVCHVDMSVFFLPKRKKGKQNACWARQLAIYFSHKYCHLGTLEYVGSRFNRVYHIVMFSDIAVMNQVIGLDPRSRNLYRQFSECKRLIDEHPAFAYMRSNQSPSQPSEPALIR